MTRNDGLAAGGYLTAAVSTLALAEWLRRRGVPAPLTRKLVHIVAGLSPLYVMAVAKSKHLGVALYTLTTLANLVFWRRGTFRSMSSSEGTPGIVYFAGVQTALLAWLWQPGGLSPRNRTLLAALLTLALSDAAAALVGQRWGQHHFHIFGHQKSWEGSAAMLLVTSFAVAATSRSAHRPNWPRDTLLAAATATAAEAATPLGLDNLSAPLAVVLVLLGTEH